MKTRPIAILLIIICTVFTSLGSFFQKKAMGHFTLSFYGVLTNYDLILGLFLMAIGAALLISALKYGELSVIHPILGFTYIWALLLAFYFLNESISIFQIGGVVLIIGGISAIGLGSRASAPKKIKLRGKKR